MPTARRTGRGVVAPLDIAVIGKRTGKMQDQFARAYRLPVGTVRDWEQNRRQPDAPARVVLSLIQAEPEMIETAGLRRLRPAWERLQR